MAILWMHEKMRDDGRAEQAGRLEISRYQPHPNSPRLRVAASEPSRREGTLLWDVNVRYSAELEEREEDENPLARPASISWLHHRPTLAGALKLHA